MGWFHKLQLSHALRLGFLFMFSLLLLYACRKDNLIDESSSIKLWFSQDTVFFDTVFTSLGSTTQNVTIHNPSKKKISISTIRLAGGPESFYRLNIDGVPGYEAHDIEIQGGDSLYVFVRVTIDPTNASNPFVVADSIIFEINGNIQDVNLVSWGQNANYILADTYIQGYPKFKVVSHEFETVTWTADKPYVIYGYAVVDSNGLLNIDRGTQIHFHNNSGLWVYKGGSLKVKGTIDAPVVFQGDRLEAFYKDLPGQWDRIWINEGTTENEINYAVIRNGFIGIQAETLQQQMGNRLVLSNTIIENMTGYGLLTRYYNMVAYNDVVVNCGQYLVALTLGGNYDIRQCTFANFWSAGVRPTPSLVLNNYYTDPDNKIFSFDLTAYFGNNIIYGRNEEELLYVSDPGAQFNYTFDHCLLKTIMDISDASRYKECLKNEDPLFMDYLKNNYELDTLSPCIDKGSMEVLTTSPFDLSRDIKENSRLDMPDLGAYEFMKPE